MYDPQKVLNVAAAEVGYREKNLLKYIFDKITGAGSKNYTKYADWMDKNTQFYNGRKQGVAWCAVFVHWCFCQAYGVQAAQKMLFIPNRSSAAGVRYCRQYFMRNSRYYYVPRPGDQGMLKKSGSDPNAMQHTFLVEHVDSTWVYSIEGNAGNGVNRRKYKLTDKRIDGYGRPDFGIDIPYVPPTQIPEAYPTLKRGASGVYVSTLQALLNKSGSALTVDGKFGPKTQAAVKAYQKAKALKVDGVVGPVTWGALRGLAA